MDDYDDNGWINWVDSIIGPEPEELDRLISSTSRLKRIFLSRREWNVSSLDQRRRVIKHNSKVPKEIDRCIRNSPNRTISLCSDIWKFLKAEERKKVRLHNDSVKKTIKIN